MKLYTVEIVDYPRDGEGGFWTSRDAIDMEWVPDGWLTDPEQRAEWIARHGDDRFFWPRTGVVYKSRSAAQARADLIASYGAKAVVLVAEPQWKSLADAKAERETARRQKRIADLRERIAALEEAS
ncbi:MAG: hypothetical protein IE923_04455 [Micrococcales bacterium]|nr:hypothetical protein [Micrococcales bacterium]